MKSPLVIIDQMTIPIPMSHPMETKAEAAKWMIRRGMQRECAVISESKFAALSGRLYK